LFSYTNEAISQGLELIEAIILKREAIDEKGLEAVNEIVENAVAHGGELR
jgi:predicted HTH transcriptional regulator